MRFLLDMTPIGSNGSSKYLRKSSLITATVSAYINSLLKLIPFSLLDRRSDIKHLKFAFCDVSSRTNLKVYISRKTVDFIKATFVYKQLPGDQ